MYSDYKNLVAVVTAKLSAVARMATPLLHRLGIWDGVSPERLLARGAWVSV